MVFAVIDLGTNTFNLLIGETLPDNSFKRLFNTKIAVKLGEGTINSGYIADAPFQRGISALKQYQQYMLDYQVEKEFAFATSAIRSASNGSDFVKAAKEQAGVSITVIDGDEEAELIYYGNRMAVTMSESISLIMDIGGGSTEFILASRDTIFWKKSFKLGAARLLERFKPCDPIREDEIEAFHTYLNNELAPLLDAAQQFCPVELIGSSGAFESVVDLIGGEFNHALVDEAITEYHISLPEYRHISNKIKASTLQERYQMPYLVNMRADMMVISVMLIDHVLQTLNLSVFRTSSFSLKEGVISKKLGLSIH